nr:hypothetical protein [Flavobacterium sp. 1355]
MFSWSEDFQYDDLHRLTSFKNATGVLENQSYDDSGRISQNGVGSYTYSATKPYQNSSIETTTAGLTYYSGRKVPTITYNSFKAPIEIIEDTVDKVSFTYNDSD